MHARWRSQRNTEARPHCACSLDCLLACVLIDWLSRCVAAAFHPQRVHILTMAPEPEKQKSSTDFIPVSQEQFKTLGADIMRRDPQGRSESVFGRRWMTFWSRRCCLDMEHDRCAFPWWWRSFSRQARASTVGSPLPQGVWRWELYGYTVWRIRWSSWWKDLLQRSKVFVRRIASLLYDVVSDIIAAALCCCLQF